MQALRTGDRAAAAKLLGAGGGRGGGAAQFNVCCVDERGFTLFHFGAECGRQAVVRCPPDPDDISRSEPDQRLRLPYIVSLFHVWL
eukprot:COSAG01_NODE_2087_length_8456_cov_2.656456_8_plen_86_part_00